MQKKNPKDTFEAWLVGELLLVALLAIIVLDMTQRRLARRG